MYQFAKNCAVFFLLMLGTFTALASTPVNPISSASQLRQALLDIFNEQRKTFLCEQPFNQKGKVSIKPCQRCPKVESNIQWMPLVSHRQLAKQLSCFNDKICINKQGKTFKGLKCCFEYDANYKKASLDLHNFVPELNTIKQQRRHFSFSLISGSDPTSDCKVIIDTKAKVIHTPIAVRGMVARAYLYMRDKYYLPLSEHDVALYQAWHREFPVSPWERKRNERIFAIQGNRNPYV